MLAAPSWGTTAVSISSVPLPVIGPPVSPVPLPTLVTVPKLLVSTSTAQAQANPFHFITSPLLQVFCPTSANRMVPSAILPVVTLLSARSPVATDPFTIVPKFTLSAAKSASATDPSTTLPEFTLSAAKSASATDPSAILPEFTLSAAKSASATDPSAILTEVTLSPAYSATPQRRRGFAQATS